MSEYRIEKVRRRVRLAIAGGPVLEGDVFLQPTARFRAGPQSVSELFNEDEAFLPVAVDGDELALVAKDHLSRVEFPGDVADTPLEGTPDAAVEVFLADGYTVRGVLYLEARADRARVLDFLNGESHRFLTLRIEGTICLVNRRLIAQVRQLGTRP